MKTAERKKARKLRENGRSVKAIAEELEVSQGSVSRWVRDIQLTAEQRDALCRAKITSKAQLAGSRANREKALKKRLEWQIKGRERQFDSYYIAGCMLYWGEGSKSRNRVVFANSDENMMRFFIEFLRSNFEIENDEFRVVVNCYLNNGITIDEVHQYWLGILSLSETSLRKPVVKTGGSSRGKLKYGVCTLKLGRTDVVQQIFGSIQEFAGFDNPDWAINK